MALAWLRTVGSDPAPVEADKRVALVGLAGHVIRVRGEQGVRQLRALITSKDWPAAARGAREEVERAIRTSSDRAPSP